MYLLNKLMYSVFFLGVLLTFSSCVTPKKSVYFADLPDTLAYANLISAKFSEPIIQSDDILSVTIQTIDPSSSTAVNQISSIPAVGASSASSVGTQTVSGFLVDKNGFIEIPMLGNIKVSGLTSFQARELIKSHALKYFKEPTVQVRFANYKVTVIGEVSRPATYTVPNEKVTILDALGLAGDLTIYGRRDNVLLIRDREGSKQFIRFNLNSTDLFKSPFYYLKQNDIIYVEPGRGKIAATNAARTQTLAIIGSALSVLIVLLSRI